MGKVLKRLTLLNKNYPLVGKNCNSENIQRSFETGIKQINKNLDKEENKKLENITSKTKVQEMLFTIVLDCLIENNCVFFGAYANQNYFNKINKRKKKSINKKIPDFDVLAEDPKITSILVQQKLKSYGFMDIKIVKKKGVGKQ